jgi:AraC-like DNA-binding protein
MQSGDYGFAKRNSLIKYNKKPPIGGKLKAFAIFFKQDFLKSFSNEYGYVANSVTNKDALMGLAPDPLFESYIQSVAPYQELIGIERDIFLSVKNKEIMLILLKTNPDLKDVLFDFSHPGKIDLEAFMNRNFKFNVSLKRFSYLTGRSLTSFKRDFEKIFNMAPGRWLMEKRLQEARYLMERNGQKPTDVYLEVGFEDLSHFSFAFKKKYGVSPNQLKQQ